MDSRPHGLTIIFDCELHFHDTALPRDFQIAIPNNIMVFEPIAAVIFSIGIVDQADIGLTYIPVARSYRGNDVYKPNDKDDVTEFFRMKSISRTGTSRAKNDGCR